MCVESVFCQINHDQNIIEQIIEDLKIIGVSSEIVFKGDKWTTVKFINKEPFWKEEEWE